MTDHISDQRSLTTDPLVESYPGEAADIIGRARGGSINQGRAAAGLDPAPGIDAPKHRRFAGLFEHVHAANYLDKGDTLVVGLPPGDFDEADLATFREELTELLKPQGVTVMVLAGVSTLACIRRPKVAEQSPAPPMAGRYLGNDPDARFCDSCHQPLVKRDLKPGMIENGADPLWCAACHVSYPA